MAAGTKLIAARVDSTRAQGDIAPLDPKTAPREGKSTSVEDNWTSERCQDGNYSHNVAAIAIKPTMLVARWVIPVTKPVKTKIVMQPRHIRLGTDGIHFVAIYVRGTPTRLRLPPNRSESLCDLVERTSDRRDAVDDDTTPPPIGRIESLTGGDNGLISRVAATNRVVGASRRNGIDLTWSGGRLIAGFTALTTDSPVLTPAPASTTQNAPNPFHRNGRHIRPALAGERSRIVLSQSFGGWEWTNRLSVTGGQGVSSD